MESVSVPVFSSAFVSVFSHMDLYLYLCFIFVWIFICVCELLLNFTTPCLSVTIKPYLIAHTTGFLEAMLVGLHLTPLSQKSLTPWAEFRTSVASRLASLCLFHHTESNGGTISQCWHAFKLYHNICHKQAIPLITNSNLIILFHRKQIWDNSTKKLLVDLTEEHYSSSCKTAMTVICQTNVFDYKTWFSLIMKQVLLWACNIYFSVLLNRFFL